MSSSNASNRASRRRILVDQDEDDRRPGPSRLVKEQDSSKPGAHHAMSLAAPTKSENDDNDKKKTSKKDMPTTTWIPSLSVHAMMMNPTPVASEDDDDDDDRNKKMTAKEVAANGNTTGQKIMDRKIAAKERKMKKISTTTTFIPAPSAVQAASTNEQVETSNAPTPAVRLQTSQSPAMVENAHQDDEETVEEAPGAVAISSSAGASVILEDSTVERGTPDVTSTVPDSSTLVQAELALSPEEIEQRYAERLHRDLPQAEVVDGAAQGEGKEAKLPWYKNKWNVAGVVLAVVIVLVVIIAASVVATRDRNSGSDNLDFGELVTILDPSLGDNYDQSVFEDPNSVQFQALQWIAEQDQTGGLDLTAQQTLERFVIVVLYLAMGGDSAPWDDSLNFLTVGASVCTWNSLDGAPDAQGQPVRRGVSCNGDNHVSTIDLGSNNIVGQLPSELMFLSSLTALRLNGNPGHSGTLPSEFFEVSNMQQLWVGGNSVGGNLPPQLGTSWGNLTSLDLSGNNFQGSIPTELFQATELRDLILSDNPLTPGPIPSALGDLFNLRFLLWGQLGLTGAIEPAVYQLSSIEAIDLSRNSLIGDIPSGFGFLSQLELLDLSSNTLDGSMPFELTLLSQLTSLSVANNPGLDGTVPTEFVFLSTLTSVFLHGTAVTESEFFSLDRTFCDEGIEWQEFWTDCLGEITCSCCTDCCLPSGTGCGPNPALGST